MGALLISESSRQSHLPPKARKRVAGSSMHNTACPISLHKLQPGIAAGEQDQLDMVPQLGGLAEDRSA